MKKRIRLYDICHSRTGDKGNNINLSLIVYNPEHYELIRKEVTAERVKAYFGNTVKGSVERYEVPNIGALNFVLHDVLGQGPIRSLRRDIYGKALSGPFLDMEIEVPIDIDIPQGPF